MKLTYREAYDRIVNAYMKDELKPFSNCACFIGNLLGSGQWSACRAPAGRSMTRSRLDALVLINSFGYCYENICSMEDNFLNEIFSITRGECFKNPRRTRIKYSERYGEAFENGVFAAMSSTLDMLKKIHEENGEIVDAPVFKKRELQPA